MTSTKSSGVENLAFEPGPENGTKVFRPYDEDKMETIDLRRSPEDREDRLQLSRNEFDVHEDSPPDGQRKALEEEDNDPRCGWCFFRPDFLQRFRTPKWVLFWLCWASAMQVQRNPSPL
ncbi:hypothetical protein RUM43_014027 [Polyplax serrata]|uniref:Uncharacterized protein n=1 Tax=Polyplax serrata TaxID=468196 RepID=A0AAN8NIY0_POLSC